MHLCSGREYEGELIARRSGEKTSWAIGFDPIYFERDAVDVLETYNFADGF